MNTAITADDTNRLSPNPPSACGFVSRSPIDAPSRPNLRSSAVSASAHLLPAAMFSVFVRAFYIASFHPSPISSRFIGKLVANPHIIATCIINQ